MSVLAAMLEASPSSLWKLQEASGSIADEVGGITGTVNQGTPGYDKPNIIPGWSDGKSFQFLNSDGGGIDFGNVYDFTGTTNYEVACWLFPTLFNAGSGHWIWGNNDSPGTRGWYFAVQGGPNWEHMRGDASAQDVGGGAIGSTQVDYINRLHFVTVRFNGTQFIVHWNGADFAPVASTRSLVAATTATGLRLGAHSLGGSGYDGYIALPAVWSGSTMTQAQREGIYRAAFGSIRPVNPQRLRT